MIAPKPNCMGDRKIVGRKHNRLCLKEIVTDRVTAQSGAYGNK
jgi:hypothetical protein